MFEAKRYHDISCGHRVVGHEGKCKNLHGHNYRITFTIEPGAGSSNGQHSLDSIGRVLDFSVIKSKLCVWLETHFDHRMLIWEEDPALHELQRIDPTIVVTGFNPTAENIAAFLVKQVGPSLLKHTGAVLTACEVEETRKCSAIYRLAWPQPDQVCPR